MNRREVLSLAFPLATGLAALLLTAALAAGDAPTEVRWKKTVVEAKFRSEGVAVADVNKDGRPDILVGDVWYEAPGWKVHEIRPIARDYGDGAKGYSESFGCFADDFNGDGWTDLIVIPFPGRECYWYENPQNKPGHWKQRMVWRSACNETPLYADGKKVLIMGIQPEEQMCWFAPPKNVDQPWDMHAISTKKAPGTHPFSHGLGVGDINKDGRNDVIIRDGWWEQPPEGRAHEKPWTFHKANLGENCADMYAFDVDGDGLNDVISSSAHARGIWWYKQLPGKNATAFTRHTILDTFTQSHALLFTDINGDGRKDLVTGKRWWAHGPTGDKDPKDPREPNTPAVLYWIEIKPGPKPEFVPHKIDEDSGIGTQFVVADINGDTLPDIITVNKKGVFVFEQVRGK
jgi:hypothetical protein